MEEPMNSPTGTNNEAGGAMSIPGEKRLNKMDCVRSAWSEIQLALAREESLTSIHSRLLGTGIPVDYHTFATYVNRLRKGEKTPPSKKSLTTVNNGDGSPACVPVPLVSATPVEAIAEPVYSDQKLRSLPETTG